MTAFCCWQSQHAARKLQTSNKGGGWEKQAIF